MGIEENKAVVRSWFDAVNRGDEAAILATTNDDFNFMTMARQPEWLLYNWNRDQFSKVPSTMSTVLKSPIQLKILDMTAEGDRVDGASSGPPWCPSRTLRSRPSRRTGRSRPHVTPGQVGSAVGLFL